MRMLSPFTPDWAWSRRRLSPDIVMGDVFDDFDRVVGSFLRPTHASSVGFQPSCDIKETRDHYLISFDIPGVKREDIRVEVLNSQLLISGERHFEINNEDRESTLRHERAYGKFERAFALPKGINAERIEAHYEDGVLNVALPKTETAKGRTIQIQNGQSSFFSRLLGSRKDISKELKDVKVS